MKLNNCREIGNLNYSRVRGFLHFVLAISEFRIGTVELTGKIAVNNVII